MPILLLAARHSVITSEPFKKRILNANRAALALLGPALSRPVGDAVQTLELALAGAVEKAWKYVLAGKGAYLSLDPHPLSLATFPIWN